MATLGQQVLTVESGWKRYDDSDRNITYTSGFATTIAFTSGITGSATHFLSTLDATQSVKFNFIGDKIRLYGAGYSTLTGLNDIYIDGILYSQHYRYTDNLIILTFEKTNLAYARHSVEIRSGTCARIYLDAIDLDVGGSLSYYIRYLIQDGTDIYTVSPSLIRIGQSPVTKAMIDNYGSYDLLNMTKVLNESAILMKRNGTLGIGSEFECILSNDILSILKAEVS